MALPLVPIAMGAANLIGGLFGKSEADKQREAAEKAYQEAVKYLEGVGIPSIEAQQIVLQNPSFIGEFAPEGESAVDLGPSEMQNISTDPRLAQAQMDALSSLQEQGANPLTDTERASLNQSRRDVAGQEQARQGAILQEMAARGQGGSGAELAARLSSSQASAERASAESDRIKAMAQERALQSLAQAGTLGGSIRGQEFSEQSSIAKAADEIARFNAANEQSVQQRNVSARNAAAQREADARQRLEESRAATANAEQKYNKELLGADYQRRMDKATQLANAANAKGARGQAQAANTAQSYSNIGSGVAQGIGAIAGMAKTPEAAIKPAKVLDYAGADPEEDPDKVYG